MQSKRGVFDRTQLRAFHLQQNLIVMTRLSKASRVRIKTATCLQDLIRTSSTQRIQCLSLKKRSLKVFDSKIAPQLYNQDK